MGIVIGIIGLVLTGIGVYLAYLQLKRQPPVVKEEEEKPPPQPPRRPEPRFITRHDREGRDLVIRMGEALGANGLVTVWGAGGVGKTTLAIEVTRRLCPSPYSGGVIWDTADEHTDFTLVSLLDTILTDLGREDVRTVAPDAKADLADRLLTEAMPCLLGLDNFETISEEEQTAITAFLDKISCPVLVTSRWGLPIGQNIHVGPMRPDEADQFLTYLVQQSPKRERLATLDRDRLAREAGHNPMLMRWMIRQLAHEMPPEDVYAGLDRGKGKAVDRIFGRSFDLLGDDGQMALLALALFVPAASREALAAVCGFEDGKDRVNEAIRRLAAFDLLDTALDPDRLGIVALTRRLTEAQLKRDERTGPLMGRFVLHFVRYALGHRDITKEDLDTLEAERDNLLAAMDYAYTAEDWQGLLALLGTIAFPGLLYTRGYWDDALRWGERGLEAAGKVHDEATIAGVAHNLANLHESRGEYDKAKSLYNQSLKTKEQLRDQAGIANSLYQLGCIAQAQGDYQQAEDLYNRSLEIATNLGDQALIAKSLHNLGILAQLQGDYQQAQDLFNRSLEIDKQLDNQADIASSLGQLGTLAQLQGDYQQAEDLYNGSLEIATNLGDQALIAKSLHNLGMLAQLQGDYQQAEDLYNRSLEIEKQLGNQTGIASSFGQLGTLAEERGKVEEAAQRYRETLAILERLGSPSAEIARRSLTRVTEEQSRE